MLSLIPNKIQKISEKSVSTAKAISLKNKRKNQAVVIFDLVGSSTMKTNIGHDKAMKKVLLHNQICRNFIKEFGGHVVKELGDAVLGVFDDAENACLCALNIREAVIRKSLSTKSVLASGKVEKLMISGFMDVFGSTVDLCSRIEKYALSNQILIDGVMHDGVISFLKNYDDIEIGKPFHTIVKDFGKRDLYEISTKKRGLQNHLNMPLRINEHGRLSIDEKVEFIKNAKIEVIEMGIGLREFTSYFSSRNPQEFKNPVKDLIKKGVRIKCFAVDPDWAQIKKFRDRDEKKYYLQIRDTLNKLKKFRDECKSEGLSGSFEIFVYKQDPLFHAQCIDGNTKNGIITISNYLNGVKRSECPVLQFSKTSHPIMFQTYWYSIRRSITNSRIWKG